MLVDNLPPTSARFGQSYGAMQAHIGELQQAGKVASPLPASTDADCGPWLRAVSPAYFGDPSLPVPAPLLETACRGATLSEASLLLLDYDLAAPLATFAAPTAIVFGAADPYGLAAQSDTASALAAARPTVATIDGACGHYPWLECADRTYPVLDAFYAAHLPR